MTKSVKVCIIPAAGEGTRWAPLSKFIPKEMLPLGDKPVIEWVVREADESGCETIVIVINRQKEVIRKYLTGKLEKSLRKKLVFVYQNRPKGIAHAMLPAKDFIRGPFVISFPDNPAIYKVPILHQMNNLYKTLNPETYLLAFSKFPEANLAQYGECLLKKKGKLHEIIHICPRLPTGKFHHRKNPLRLMGRIIFPESSLKLSQKVVKESLKDKPSDATVINLAMSQGKPVLGAEVKCFAMETGNPTSYAHSILHSAKYF